MTSTFSCFVSRVYPLIVQFSLSFRLNLSFSKAFLKTHTSYIRWIKKAILHVLFYFRPNLIQTRTNELSQSNRTGLNTKTLVSFHFLHSVGIEFSNLVYSGCGVNV